MPPDNCSVTPNLWQVIGSEVSNGQCIIEIYERNSYLSGEIGTCVGKIIIFDVSELISQISDDLEDYRLLKGKWRS